MEKQMFGGPWTLLKLEILEKYFGFYTQALKNHFNLCYIDAFAGSGNVTLKDYGTTFGSALRALDYPFDQYFYIEKNRTYLKQLEENIIRKRVSKNVKIVHGDCNELLRTIHSYDWYGNHWRGVIFLDPYAMDLDWDALVSISKTQVFDIWYLFPISALNRNLPKDGEISVPSKEKINRVLGTQDWEKEIYFESPQMTLFEEPSTERKSFREITIYVLNRLRTIFPAVSPNSRILTLSNKSPIFLLCFAVSNPSKRAIKLSLEAANHILTHTK